jgi:hypothetical protein
METSRQEAVWQVATVAPRRMIEEAAPLVVLAPLRPPARANRRVSFSMMTRYRLMRMSLCRSGCDDFLVPGLPRSTRRS